MHHESSGIACLSSITAAAVPISVGRAQAVYLAFQATVSEACSAHATASGAALMASTAPTERAQLHTCGNETD